MKNLIYSQIDFLKKIKREYINQPDYLPENVGDDLIDMGVHILSEKSIDYDKHFINQINNQINFLKSKLK